MSETVDDPLMQVRVRALLAWLVICVAVAILLGVIGTNGYLDRGVALALATGALHLALAAWIVTELRSAGASLGAIVGRLPRRVPWREVAMVVVAGGVWSAGANLLVSIGLTWWMHSVDAVVPPFLTDLSATHQPVTVGAILFFLFVVMAPVVEEIVFRGIVLRRLARRWGVRSAVVGSSLLFGVLHGRNVLGSSAIGLLCALLYLRTGTLSVPIVAHAANNLVPALVAVAYMVVASGGTLEAPATWSSADLTWALPVAAVGLALVVAVYVKLRPRNGWVLPRSTLPTAGVV